MAILCDAAIKGAHRYTKYRYGYRYLKSEPVYRYPDPIPVSGTLDTVQKFQPRPEQVTPGRHK